MPDQCAGHQPHPLSEAWLRTGKDSALLGWRTVWQTVPVSGAAPPDTRTHVILEPVGGQNFEDEEAARG